LCLLAVLVDFLLLVEDGTLTLLKLILHAFDVLFLTVGACNLACQVLILILDCLLVLRHLLFSVTELVANQRQLTLLLHPFVNFH